MGYELRHYTKLSITIMILMVICVACSNSPVESDNQNKEYLDFEKILKDMVLIPAGDFLMGSLEDEGSFDEHPQHKVYLDAFYMDKYEVTNVQFKEFVDKTGYVTDAERSGVGEVWNPAELGGMKRGFYRGPNWRQPHVWQEGRPHPDSWESDVDRMNYPVTQVSWNDAQAYAKCMSKRLPTEAEWEKAARGTDGRKFPWGDVFNLDIKGITTHTNVASMDMAPVGSFATGISPYGIFNMAGNVQEWVADWYASDYYIHSQKNNPKGPDTGKFRVIRGASWRQTDGDYARNSSRSYNSPGRSSNFIGFRCAVSLEDLSLK